MQEIIFIFIFIFIYKFYITSYIISCIVLCTKSNSKSLSAYWRPPEQIHMRSLTCFRNIDERTVVP